MAVQGGAGGYSPAPRVRFEAIGQAWNLFKVDAGTWVVAALIVTVILLVVTGAASVVSNMLMPSDDIRPTGMGAGAMMVFFGSSLIVQGIIGIFLTIAYFVVTAGMYRMALRRLRGEQISVGEVFNIGNVFPNLLLASLLYAVIVGIAALLCLIPGIIAAALLMFTAPLILDRQMDGAAAISVSFRTLSGDFLNAVVFYLVLSFIAFAGIFLCCVGILVTMPLYYLGVAIVYRDFFPDQAATPVQQQP